jgi:hypothetical protein
VSGTRPRSGPLERDGWLRRHAVERSRPWALEEQLLAPQLAPDRERELAALANRILAERVRLERLRSEVGRQAALIAELEERLSALVGSPTTGAARPEPSQAPPVAGNRTTVELGQPHVDDKRDYLLSRCHGFRVESDDHPIGIVEGVRFGSSATRPDLIEVRAGRLGRRLILVPVEQVEDIIEEEEAVLLRASQAPADLAHALLARLRERFGHQVAT